MKKIGFLVVFVLFLNLFLFHRIGAAAFVLFTLGLFLFISSLYWKQKSSHTMSTIIAGGVLLSLSWMTLLTRTSEFVRTIHMLSVLVIGMVLLYLLTNSIPFVRSLAELLVSPLILLSNYLSSLLGNQHGLLAKLLTLDLPEKYRQHSLLKHARAYATGLIISIPIVWLLLALLSGADPIFGSEVARWFGWLQKIKLGRLPTHLIFSTVCFFVFAPLLLLERKNDFKSPLASLVYAPVRELTTVMGLVAAVLGLFLLVQWPYVFVSVPYETDLSKFGVATYSEYVKRGFGELVLTSLIIYGLIWLGLIALRHGKNAFTQTLRTVQLVVLGEFGIFLLSIFRRVWLYQNYHGWSLSRLYGAFLLVWICGITLFLLLRHIKPKRWVIGEVALTLFVITTIGFINAEDFVVRTHPPTVNKRIDYMYLSRLSPDGYQGWKRAYEFARRTLEAKSMFPFLNREDRRDIAYAGMVTSRLLANQFRLLRQQGSQEELQAYYQIILTALVEKQKSVAQQLEQLMQQELGGRNEIPIGSGNTQLEIEYRNLRESITLVEQTLGQLATTSDSLMLPISIGTGTMNNYDLTAYLFNQNCDLITTAQDLTITQYYNNHGCKQHVFTVFRNTHTLQADTDYLNYLFTWNATRQRVYNDILTDMPLPQLLKLQDMYMSLVTRIKAQPSADREFDIDVSFASPFID